MRRMHPKNLIKTPEELEMMHSGLINVRNIPITREKDIMNAVDYRSRSRQISAITYNKTICYHFKRDINRWNTKEIETYGKKSGILATLDKPETSWFNKQYYKMSQISFETREEITTEKREDKRDCL